jgi:hypothetical protein
MSSKVNNFYHHFAAKDNVICQLLGGDGGVAEHVFVKFWTAI